MRPQRSDAVTGPRVAAVAPSRDLAIDRFRGGLIILMVAGNYLAGVDFVPAFLKHTPDVGLTVADVVAPGFVFAIGLTYRRSFVHRARQDVAGAYRHFLRRNLSLIGIGAIISAGSTSVAHQPSDWGVLQALGAAGLLCLAVVRLSMTARFVTGLLVLCGYQYLLEMRASEPVPVSSHGGFVGSLSWGALLILSTAMGDLYRSGLGRYVGGCLGLAVVATVSAFLEPVSKIRVSPSFVLVCLTLAAVAWLLVDLGSRSALKPAGYLCWWGENPLVLYLVHLGLLGALTVPSERWWYAGASVPLAAAQLLALLALSSTTAWWLHRRGARIGL
jgi:predicted acyltransferase